jgi:hypothetical protein
MKKTIVIILCIVVFGLVSIKTITTVIAEQRGISPESGVTSRLGTMSADLVTKGYGSTSSGSWGNWGSIWNRIYSASIWTPSDGTATVADVASGKTFYAGSNRTKKTGTMSAAIDFSTQQYSARDDYGGPNGSGAEDYQGEEAVWTEINSAAVPNKVWKDTRTGLYWSSTISTSMTNSFTISTCNFFNITTYPYKGNYEGGVTACGDAINACATSTVGGRSDWYLPSQKELLQAYIDGMYNKAGTTLANAASFTTTNSFWSSSETSANSVRAWLQNLNNGSGRNSYDKTGGAGVRCVARDL